VVISGKEKYIQASWQKEIFSVDLFFSKARFFRFLVNSSLFKCTPLFRERIAYTVTPEAIAQSLCRRRERLEDRMRELDCCNEERRRHPSCRHRLCVPPVALVAVSGVVGISIAS
jgi:hypothetical protein